ncbi:hypothetical protein ACFL5Z_11650 [Planctomycetota bacterium]
MSTESQIKANRLNAQKSTGPKTAEGKAAVSQNAVKHGLFAHENVIRCEKQADFDNFRDELLAGLAPVGGVESMMAERIVSLSWRLKRAERMNSEAIDVMIAKIETDSFERRQRREAGLVDPEDERSELVLGWVTIKDFKGSNVLERLLMYEKRIESSLYKAMNELQKLQRMREKEQAEAVEVVPTIPIPIKDNRDEAARPSEGEGPHYEKQSQCRPAAGSTKHEILNQHAQACTIVQNKANRQPLTGNPKHETLNPKQR